MPTNDSKDVAECQSVIGDAHFPRGGAGRGTVRICQFVDSRTRALWALRFEAYGPTSSTGFYTSTYSVPEHWLTFQASGKLTKNSDIKRMNPKFHLRSLLLLFVSGLLLIGCGQTSMQAGKSTPDAFAPWTEEKTEYTVGVGDEVEVKLPYNAEFSDRVTVGPDGRFTLPLIGEVRAEGRTVADLTAELDSRFSQDLRSPRVQVAIRNYVSQRFFVGGEVTKPGVYPLQGRIGLMEAITMANGNGSLDTARMSKVVLIRRAVATASR